MLAIQSKHYRHMTTMKRQTFWPVFFTQHFDFHRAEDQQTDSIRRMLMYSNQADASQTNQERWP
ncbi:hypothetical protein CN311_27965 [Mesorhizobium sanjuanii]|uniref:Uncharacterized protein n=1 Tax=Mesorhizobium sanjuanii TaxID=2037900 RepID=A0A2A6F8N2_9HYPH|nr:hypothetical protein CN311_27965 [Mesorhizobium sanjuanii]